PERRPGQRRRAESELQRSPQTGALPMIESIRFHNYKVLKDTELPLGRFTLLVGPNGSGKSTALESFEVLRRPGNYTFAQVASADVRAKDDAPVAITLAWSGPSEALAEAVWRR